MNTNYTKVSDTEVRIINPTVTGSIVTIDGLNHQLATLQDLLAKVSAPVQADIAKLTEVIIEVKKTLGIEVTETTAVGPNDADEEDEDEEKSDDDTDEDDDAETEVDKAPESTASASGNGEADADVEAADKEITSGEDTSEKAPE